MDSMVKIKKRRVENLDTIVAFSFDNCAILKAKTEKIGWE